MQNKGDMTPSSYPNKLDRTINENASYNGENIDLNVQTMYVDPDTIQHQKKSSLTLVEDQVRMAKQRAATEYEMQKHAILMKAEHDLKLTQCAMEQSEAQSLFAIDQEYQQRKLEIEQKAQEQRMQIETTASQLILTAQQQRMQRDMERKLAELQSQLPQGNSFHGWNFSTSADQ